MNKQVIFETDWIASKPVFYNEHTLKISHNINDVIDINTIEFHPEGLNNYLDFGYSILGQTPIKGVKFLRHSSKIQVINNKLVIEELPDPVEEWFARNKAPLSTEEVFEKIKRSINNWEQQTSGNIIIPTSGGYDSRLLNYFISDKSRIRAFTYGISKKQEESFEVVYAQELCKRLHIQWQQIFLGEFHKYIDSWENIFGVSVHAHGMYHMEFYEKIKSLEPNTREFLSGIVGDAWAGSIKPQHIENSYDLYKLGYTHGMHADGTYSKLISDNAIKNDFFNKNKKALNDPKRQIVETIRLKIMLISYLMRLPVVYGFTPWSPFLDMDIALSMLSLDETQRKNRGWQKDFFSHHELDIESENLYADTTNYLNHQAIKDYTLTPLSPEIFQDIIETSYIHTINKTLFDPSVRDSIVSYVISATYLPPWVRVKMQSALRRLGIKNNVLKAYCAYLTLLPLEKLLLRSQII